MARPSTPRGTGRERDADGRAPGDPAGSSGPDAERNPVGRLPSRQAILDFIAEAPLKAGKRELARAFNIKGDDRAAFKELLREMARDGQLAGNRKSFREPGQLGARVVAEIVGNDDDGELLAEPVRWETEHGPRPLIRIVEVPRRMAGGAPGRGDRFLLKPHAIHPDRKNQRIRHEAIIVRRLARADRPFLGIFRTNVHTATPLSAASVMPIDKKQLRATSVLPGDENGAGDGDLVEYTLATRGHSGLQKDRITNVLDTPEVERQVSLIAIHAHGLPHAFPNAIETELARLPDVDPAGRTDLTDLALLTIDPPDARDHDDAVWAGPDTDPQNPGGHVVVVAIADVAHYVRPGSALDEEALKRGNSVYFPDRVVPMLPERISNDLCSLREGELRPCLAVRMVFGADGVKRRQEFMRAVMRSHAKLSYIEAQAAIDHGDGMRDPDAAIPIGCGPDASKVDAHHASPAAISLRESCLVPLWRAFQALNAARRARAPLELDLPERKIILNAQGLVEDIRIPPRLDAHRLIEEFMIQANVAAAEALEKAAAPVVYRVHDSPSREKHLALKDFLDTLELTIPPAQNLKPAHLNAVLTQVVGQDVEPLVNEVVLRAQSQAEYTPENIGHFGLNLQRYAHFTSPIRRYADLLVHRALVRLVLGAQHARPRDGLRDEDIGRLADMARSISMSERKAMQAERETVDRLIAMHLSTQCGARFRARISGVTRSGLFVRLHDTGADGFIPISTLDDDYYIHHAVAHALVGERSHKGYRLGASVEVRLEEVVASAGAMRFSMVSHPEKIPTIRAALGKGGRDPAARDGRGKGRTGHRGRVRRRQGRREGRR